jgi:8-oxo-dGTP pyrophosphatase MutT (NUDIX family)
MQMKSKEKIVSFDFDNTIAITYIDFSDEDNPDPKFIEYNQDIVALIREHIDKGDEVYIVTSRIKALEADYPEAEVPYHLRKLNLSEYFLPNRVFYMDGGLKTEKLLELNVDLHYDDNMEEYIACKNANISVKNPYEFYEDADIVAKSVIYDAEDNILVLKRGDEGTKWDFPGGHVKKIELQRGEFGLEGGLEREVAEETGLILPNHQFYFKFPNVWKDNTNEIHVFLSKLDEVKPDVDLMVQDFQENIEYHWVPMSELGQYEQGSTSVFREIIEKLLSENKVITKEGQYLLSQHRNWRKMKTKLLALGKNKSTGGGKGHKQPDLGPSKNVLALESDKSKKKSTIKVRIVKNEEELEEKKKKRRKKRKKKRKSKAYYPYYSVYDTSSDGFGDGGGE